MSSYLTEDKLAVLGSAGAIGSNMVQLALTLRLTPNVALYDPYEKGNEGVAEEIRHCSFPGARIHPTSDVGEALDGASYVISSGGAPRKEGMTREDLLKGNCEIAAQLGKDIKSHCPDAKLVIIIFNPADVTGLTTLVHSGLPPTRVATLAALDSTRLQTELARHFVVPQDEVTGCRTYGGHGEQMAVFASTAKIQGKPLTDLIGTHELSEDDWHALQQRVRQGGKRIIELRGRSSFQSPSHHAVHMVKSVVDGSAFSWPCGTYVDEPDHGIEKVMMAAETHLGPEGVRYELPQGTEEENQALRDSYEHLRKLRDEVVEMGQLPPLEDWGQTNPHLG